MEMKNAPAITLNGASRLIGDADSLVALLDAIGLAGRPVVIELNERAVFPRDYASTPLAAGDRLEIVTLAAGG